MATKTASAKSRRTRSEDFRVVATNSVYGTLCRRSWKRLPSRYRSKFDVLSFSSLENVKLPTRKAKSTLFISRLSDIPKEGVERAWGAPKSKHLLFLEGLPVEAMPARLLQLDIRNPHRLHVAAERRPDAIVELVYRLFSGMAHGAGPRPIVDAWVENEHLVLLSPSFDRLAVPLDELAKWIGNDETTVSAFEIDKDGRFLYWPHADAHLGWDQFVRIIDPAAALADKRKSKSFNAKCGTAIRALREDRNLKQSDITGITERHLRRVEHGQQSASRGSLEVLAKAHGMLLDEYVRALARRLGKRT